MKAKCIKGTHHLINEVIYEVKEINNDVDLYEVTGQDGERLGQWYKSRFEVITNNIKKKKRT